jgi:hypothetical protein
MQRAFAAITAKLPQGWGDFGRQIGLLVLVDLAYETVRGMADGQRAVAFANGQQIIDIERSTHTFFEPSMQAFFIKAQWLVDFANQVYMNSQFAVVVTFFFWLYFFRNDAFYFVRNMFMVAMGLALIGYAAFPTAPPRFFAEAGFTDTIASFADVDQDSGAVGMLVNPYAAVPSMHIAFALMIAVPGMLLSRSAAARVFWSAYPLLVLFVIVVTANHYWFDAAAGAAVACLAALTADRVLSRVRPESWAWPQAPERAPGKAAI